MITNFAPEGMTLTIRPLVAEGKMLLPVGQPFNIVTDYLHIGRAVIEECRERNWSVHKRSKAFTRRVSAETPPKAVVRSEGGLLLAVWVGGVA